MTPDDKQIDLDAIVDIEAYFAEQREVPHGKKYKIRIDKQYYVVHDHRLTGSQILALAGKTPKKFLLREKCRHGVVPVEPNQEVNLVERKVERFMTIPNEVTEGDQMQQRIQFPILPTDQAYLNSLGLRWEAVKEGDERMVVIYDWSLPLGYNIAKADVHVRLTPLYPDAQIDMAYFTPELTRADGRSIGGLCTMAFDGRQWQRWSRHRTSNSAWRIGEDDLSTHMPLVQSWLQAELLK